MWESLKSKKDKFMCRLGHVINSGVVNLEVKIDKR